MKMLPSEKITLTRGRIEEILDICKADFLDWLYEADVVKALLDRYMLVVLTSMENEHLSNLPKEKT